MAATSGEQESPRAVLVYESMFGCTRDVADAVAVGLAAGGLSVELVQVTQAPPFADLRADLLVVGAPTHAFSLSRPSTRRDAVRQGAPAAVELVGMREWLEAVVATGAGRGRLAAAFDTRVTKVRWIPKAAATRASRLLRQGGFELVSPPMGFVVDDTKGPLLAGEVDRARTWGHAVATTASQQVLGEHPAA